MFKLNVTVHSPVGVFKGRIKSPVDITKEDLTEIMDTLQKNSINYIVLEGDGIFDGEEISLHKEVLINSVLVWSISSID